MSTNLPKQVINLSKATDKNKSALMKDMAFKSFMKYKGIVALILKHVVIELEDLSEIEIVKSIKNINARPHNIPDIDAITDKIDLLPSEDGEVGEKNIRYDITFLLSVNNENIKIDLTIGLEMQQITSEKILDYNIVSRAVYYAASLLRNTITADNKDYSQIHKVYSIWFCKNDIFSEEERTGLYDKGYIHRYKMLRAYYPSIKGTKGEWIYDKNADLMEVVMLELSRIPEDTTEDKLGTTIKTLFFETEAIIPMINKVYGVDIGNTVIEQEVNDMYEKQDFINEGIEIGKEISKQEFINEGIEIGKEIAKKEFINEGIEIGKQDGQLLAATALLSKQIKKGKTFTEQSAIKFLSENLDLSPELAQQAFKQAFEQAKTIK